MADEQVLEGRRRPSRRAVALAALAVVAIVIVVIVSSGGSSTSARATTKSSGTATIAVRDLVSTDTESGTLGYADTRTVYNRLSGTITWLPAVGAVVRPGHSLLRVDGQPIVLMSGALPAYRALQAGITDGPDVRELEQTLRALGDDPGHAMTIDGHFDAATTAAVEKWQGQRGLTENGQIELGRVVFLPGVRRVTAVDAGLGGTGGGSASAGAATTGASYTAPGGDRPSLEYASYVTTDAAPTTPATTTPTSTTTTPTTPTTTTPTTTTPTPATPKKKTKKKAKSKPKSKRTTSSTGSRGSSGGGGRSGGSGGSGGSSGSSGSSGSGGSGASASSSSGGSSAQAALETTSTERVVSVDLDATKQSEATVGEPVSVQLPDSSYAQGHITAVGTVATSTASSSSSTSGGGGGGGGGSSSDTSATIPVTIVLDRHQKSPHLDQAAVSVAFQQEVRRHVLSVPVTSLLATAGGGYAVELLNGSSRRLVPVQPGLFAGGYVEITGQGLASGMRVTDAAE